MLARPMCALYPDFVDTKCNKAISIPQPILYPNIYIYIYIYIYTYVGSTQPLSGLMRSYLNDMERLRSRILRLTTVGDPPHRQRDTPLFTRVGAKFRRQLAVDQSG
jgi:hypothetical protein